MVQIRIQRESGVLDTTINLPDLLAHRQAVKQTRLL